MSENITFNLPITISRERFDAIVKEAARKIYTDGLFDPTDALSPAVAEAVQKQMEAPQATPPGVIQAGTEPSPRPGPAQADKGSGHGDPDRLIPPYAWGHLHAYVRARSVPTAALLAQRASIERWTSDGIVVFKMARPFAEQFSRQQTKHTLLGLAVKSVFGPDARWDIVSDSSGVVRMDDLGPPRAAVCLKRLVKILSDVTISRSSGTTRGGAYAMFLHNKRSQDVPVGPGGEDGPRWPISKLSEIPLAYWREKQPDRLLVVRTNYAFKRDGLFEPWGEVTSALLQSGAIIPRSDGSVANQAVIDTQRVYGLMFNMDVLRNFGFPGIQTPAGSP